MPRGATVFDGMASETLKQLLYVHYSAANLSEADKQEYLGIVEEEEDYTVLLELCASEGVAAPPTAAAPPPTAGPPPQVGDKVISTVNFTHSTGSVAIGDEGVVQGPCTNHQAAGWKERVNCAFPGHSNLNIRVREICF